MNSNDIDGYEWDRDHGYLPDDADVGLERFEAAFWGSDR